MGNSLCKVLLAALGLCHAICASAQQAAQPAPAQSVIVTGQKNASSWFRAESEHFIVFSDTRNEDVTQLLNNLERLDYLLRIYTREYNTAGVGGAKISLYYHDRVAGFNAIAKDQPGEAVGLYNSCATGVQGFGVHLERIANRSNEQLAKDPLDAGLSYIFEAYARHFLYRYTDIRAPDSYIDGFAQYFSSVRFSEHQMVLGRPPAGVARYLYFLDQGHRYTLSYQDIFEPGVSSRDLGYTAKSGVRLEFLAKSWLLTHYMLSSATSRAQADKYLDLVHHDLGASKAFETAFGFGASEIDQVMWRYRLKGIQVVQVDLPSLPSPQISFTSLPESITDFVLADAALKSCPDRKAGESLLQTLSQRPGGLPNNELAKLSLSRAQIDWGRAEDALPYLLDATRKDAANAEASYLLGLANLRLAERHKDSASEAYLQAARQNLARARKMNPTSAEAAFAFYKAELLANDKPDKAALDAAILASKNAHEVSTFARSAALAFAYAGRAPEADNALALMAHNARDPEMAKWAKTWQSRLNAGVSRAELVAEMHREPSPPTAFKEWTVASENLMKEVQYNAGAEDSRGYLETLRLGDPFTETNQFSLPGKR